MDLELDPVSFLLGLGVFSVWLLCLSPWEDHQWPKRMQSPQKRKFKALIFVVATGVGLWWHEEYGDGWTGISGIYGLVLTVGQVIGAALEWS